MIKITGPRLNIKTIFPRYVDSYVKDKTVGETVLSLTWELPYPVRPSFLLRRPPGILSTDHVFPGAIEQGFYVDECPNICINQLTKGMAHDLWLSWLYHPAIEPRYIFFLLFISEVTTFLIPWYYPPLAILMFNRMAWQWAETLVEIRGTLADIRGTTK